MTTIHRIACPIPFPLKTVNCYYIHDSRPALIDCGVDTPESLACVEAAIRGEGSTLQAVRRVIITHAHTDHAGLAGRLANDVGCEVYLHRHEYPKFLGAEARPKQAYLERFERFLLLAGLSGAQARMQTEAFAGRVRQLVAPLAEPRLLSGGETFAFDDFELRVAPTPGHSAGSVSLVDAVHGTVFSGDFLLEHVTPNPVAEFGLPGGPEAFDSLAAFTASLEWFRRQKLTRVLPGHGAPFTHARFRVTAVLDHFQRRRQKVLRTMARVDAARPGGGGITPYQLALRLFPGLKKTAMFLGVSGAFAYLQRLEAEAHIESWRERGVYRGRLRRRLQSPG